jgi:hypothetical protein
MLTQEREITQVAKIIVIVVAAGIVTCVTESLVVRLTEDAKVRKVDGAVGLEIRADDYDINANRSCACSNIQESLTLARNIHAACKNAAARSNTA